MEQLESTEFVVDFVTTAGAVATDDEDDKTLSQKDDKTHKCALGALYLALSCSISQSAGFVQYLCKQKKTPPQPVRASHWGVLPSRGTDGHSVHLLKTSLAPDGRE